MKYNDQQGITRGILESETAIFFSDFAEAITVVIAPVFSLVFGIASMIFL